LHTELTLGASTLAAFLFVLARISGAVVFIPLPGSGAQPAVARVVLSLGCTFALAGRWPHVDANQLELGRMIMSLFAETALGITIGLAVSFLIEAFVFGAQVLSVNMGFGFVTTVDPSSQASTGIMQSFAQIAGGLLFFTLGLDRELIRIFAGTLDTIPPGAFVLKTQMAYQMIALSANILSIGLRLSYPLMGLLLMVDITVALLSRINQQLHIQPLTFTLKILLGLAMFSWLLLIFPRLYSSYAEQIFKTVHSVLQL
jgi:flagellar biosynthetic protein FliR